MRKKIIYALLCSMAIVSTTPFTSYASETATETVISNSDISNDAVSNNSVSGDSVSNNASNVSDTEVIEDQEEEETPFEFGENGEYFRTQEGFDKYYSTLKNKLEKNPDDASTFFELYFFISGGGATKEQAESVLNDGYLTEYINEFKKSEVISSDYKLPDGVKVIETKMPATAKEDAKLFKANSVGHYFDNLDDKAIEAISQLLFDTDSDDAYITINFDTDVSTKLPLVYLTESGYNREPLTIKYMDSEEERISYGWTFEHQIFSDTESEIDLSVLNNGTQVSFDLGVEMVQPVKVYFNTGKADTEYVVTDTETKETQMVTSDETGLVSIWDADGKGTYEYIKYKKPVETKKDSSSSVTKLHGLKDIGSMPTGIVLQIIIGFAAILGLILMIWGMKRK